MDEIVKSKSSEEFIRDYESLSDEAYEMLSLTKRVQSFKSWPYGEKAAPEEMAKAGWYQTGPLCCRHVIALNELDGWDGDEDPVAEVNRRKSALTSIKWSPGVKSLAIPDNEVLVGTRYRLIKLQKISLNQKAIDDLKDWQEEQRIQLMEKLHAKYVNKEDAEHKVEMFSSTLGRKLNDQLSRMETSLDTYKRGLSVKFRTKKNKPKIRFHGKADDNDLQLSTMAEKLWDDVVSKEDENTPPTGCLSKPHAGNKSRQSMLAPTNSFAKPPSARKAKNENVHFSRNTSGYPSIPEFASIPE